MALQLQNFTTLVSNAAAAVQASARTLVDFTAGSLLRALVEANAAMALWLQWLVVQVLALTRLATSNGTDVDSWGRDFRFSRLAAVAATGNVTFSRYVTGQTALIPAGAQVKTADGTQIFTVLVDTTNASWSPSQNGYAVASGAASVTVPVQAVNAGIQGNVQIGAIRLLASAITGVDTVTNAAVFSNGIDAESDAAFRARFVLFINSRSAGTLLAVQNAVAGVQAGLSYTVAENVDPGGATRYGNFVVTVDDGSGTPPAPLLVLVRAAVDAIRPLTSTYVVQAPTVLTANVAFSFTVNAGYTKADLLAAVANAVSAYIGALPLGVPLVYSRLFQIIYDSTPGVATVTGLTINSATADLGGLPSQAVIPGTVVAS